MNTVNSNSNFTNPIEELIAGMAEEALQYVDKHYGSHHAIANSVHRDVEVICKQLHKDDAGELQDAELFWGVYSDRAPGAEAEGQC